MHADGSSRGPDRTVPGATHALLLLVLINLFNYIDRQVLAAVEPHVRQEFFPDVKNPTTGETEEPEEAKELMGWLAFAFLATYMLLAPAFGALATRMSRWWLIAGGVVVWSLASGASGASEWIGLSSSGEKTVKLLSYTLPVAYVAMFLTRCVVGVGEAVYGPIAPDVISDLYPVSKRGQVLAWFYAAIPFGGAIGYALGEVITSATGHWSYAFYAVVLPGLGLGVWCLFLPEVPRPAGSEAQKPSSWADYGELFTIPSYSLNVAGMTFMCFVIGGLAFWAPAYLKYRQVPAVLGVGPATFFGVLTAGLGLVATLAGGMAGDALRGRVKGAYFAVSGAAMCLGAPMLVAMVYLPFPLAWVPMAGAIFCLFFNTGPTNTITANVIRPSLRAKGYAVAILVMHLLGDAASPTLMGRITGKANRYDLAFLVVAGAMLLGGLVWLWGALYLDRDTERASGEALEPGLS